MNKLYKYLAIGAIAATSASCADELDTYYEFEKPASIADYEEYNSLKSLAESNKAKSGVSLAAAVDAEKFIKNDPSFVVAKGNFSEVVATKAMTFGACYFDGGYDFSNVEKFVKKAKDNSIGIFGHVLCWHNQQPVDYLNKLVKDKPDPEAEKHNWTMKFNQAEAKANTWDSNFYLTWNDALELGEDYVLEFRAKTTTPGGTTLQVEVFDNQGGNCSTADQHPDKDNSWKYSYSAESDIPFYGVNVNETWTNLKYEFKAQSDKGTPSPNSTTAHDGTEFQYKKLQFGTGKVAGDLLIDDVRIYKKGGDPVADNVVPNSGIDDEDVSNWSIDTRWDDVTYSSKEVTTPYVEEGIRCLKLAIPKDGTSYKTQIWFVGDENHKFVKGASYEWSFKACAEKAFSPSSGTHGKPDGNNWKNGGFISPKITTEWKEFSGKGTFEDDKNAEAYTVALDLASADFDNVLYLDDISIKINGEEIVKNGSVDSDDLSGFVWKPADNFQSNPDIIFSGDLTYYITEIKEAGIPQTPEELADTLKFAMNGFYSGLFKASAGYVSSWTVASEPLAAGSGDIACPSDPSAYGLQSASNFIDDGIKAKDKFFWAQYLGADYVRLAVETARAKAAEFGISDMKLFVEESGLEADENKLKSFLSWVKYWEADGKTKIDGVAAQLHISYIEDAAEQKALEASIDKMFKDLAASGKIVRISQLDMGYRKSASAKDLKASAVTKEMQIKMGEFYTTLLKSYFSNVPAAQQGGICQWSLTTAQDKRDAWRAGQPVGLWSENFQRLPQYEGFLNGLE